MNDSSQNNLGGKSPLQTILIAWLISGTLDILSAIVNCHFSFHIGPVRLFQFIASGAFGKQAFSGGWAMVCWGLFFHYLTAFTWTLIFFFLYPKIKWFSKNKIIAGILYGAFVWLVMNLIVAPLSSLPKQPFSLFQTILGILFLLFFIGIPNAIIIGKYYDKGRNT
jgi:hypothetical protein